MNDKIIGVAQGDAKFVDVIDMKLREVVKLIRGAKGTKVELKVLPDGKLEPVVYVMTRQQIEIKSRALHSTSRARPHTPPLARNVRQNREGRSGDRARCRSRRRLRPLFG